MLSTAIIALVSVLAIVPTSAVHKFTLKKKSDSEFVAGILARGKNGIK